jgi:hypothetical protein
MAKIKSDVVISNGSIDIDASIAAARAAAEKSAASFEELKAKCATLVEALVPVAGSIPTTTLADKIAEKLDMMNQRSQVLLAVKAILKTSETFSVNRGRGGGVKRLA